jgi:hypothetical protein
MGRMAEACDEPKLRRRDPRAGPLLEAAFYNPIDVARREAREFRRLLCRTDSCSRHEGQAASRELVAVNAWRRTIRSGLTSDEGAARDGRLGVRGASMWVGLLAARSWARPGAAPHGLVVQRVSAFAGSRHAPVRRGRTSGEGSEGGPPTHGSAPTATRGQRSHGRDRSSIR